MKSLIQRAVKLLERIRTRLLSNQIFTSTILPSIPRPLRWALRKLYFLPIDLGDRLTDRTRGSNPPKSQIFTGAVDGFASSGKNLLRMLVDVAGLKPDTAVLDVGCGIGRLAVPLAQYLSPDGLYCGLDIVPSGIAWCNENIASAHPQFHFTLADVYNKEYQPNGHVKASEYRFPYEDDTFDLVVLISVFTHMMPSDMENYLREIGRVLKPGGRCFATYFLVNDDSLARMQRSESSLRFKYHLGNHWVVTTRVPELSVGYDEPYVIAVHDRLGFATAGGVHYGGWCGRAPFWSHESGLGDQDVVIGVKR